MFTFCWFICVFIIENARSKKQNTLTRLNKHKIVLVFMNATGLGAEERDSARTNL